MDDAGSNGEAIKGGPQGLIANVPGQQYGPLVVAQTSLPLPWTVYGQVGNSNNPAGQTE